jgi:ABC-2 type transport system permease protein
MDISSMMEISLDAAMKKFFQDLFQITSLVIIFSLMGIISNEISEKKFNIPFSINKKASGVIIGKLIVYGTFVFISTSMGSLIAFYYSNFIFDDTLEIFIVIKSVILYSIFYIFLISIIMCFSTFFKRTIFTAVFSIFVLYTSSFITNINKIEKYIPANLLNIANEFNNDINGEMIYSVLISILIIVIVNFISCKKLSKIEL